MHTGTVYIGTILMVTGMVCPVLLMNGVVYPAAMPMRAAIVGTSVVPMVKGTVIGGQIAQDLLRTAGFAGILLGASAQETAIGEIRGIARDGVAFGDGRAVAVHPTLAGLGLR